MHGVVGSRSGLWRMRTDGWEEGGGEGWKGGWREDEWGGEDVGEGSRGEMVDFGTVGTQNVSGVS